MIEQATVSFQGVFKYEVLDKSNEYIVLLFISMVVSQASVSGEKI